MKCCLEVDFFFMKFSLYSPNFNDYSSFLCDTDHWRLRQCLRFAAARRTLCWSLQVERPRRGRGWPSPVGTLMRCWRTGEAGWKNKKKQKQKHKGDPVKHFYGEHL